MADATAAFDEPTEGDAIDPSTGGPLPSIARRRAFRQAALDLDHRPSRREQWTAEMAALFETAS